MESKLIDTPGDYLFPLWTADGKRVVYIADHGGTTDLWTLDVTAGKAAGKPQRLRQDLGRTLPMGIAANGQYIYGVRAGETDVFITTLNAAKADAETGKRPVPRKERQPGMVARWPPACVSLLAVARRISDRKRAPS